MKTIVASVKSNRGTLALIVVAALVNVYWWRLLSAQSPAGKLKAAEQSLIGRPAPPIVGQLESGEWTTLTFSNPGERAILYVVSPECVWCARNVDNARALEAQTRGKFAMVGLVASGSVDSHYGRSHNLPFRFLYQPSANTRAAYHMGGTPQTIVIDEGRIVANWVGAYGESRAYEIQQFFGLTLPGLTEDPTPADAAPRVGCTAPDGGFYSPGAKLTIATKAVRCDRTGQWQPEPSQPTK